MQFRQFTIFHNVFHKLQGVLNTKKIQSCKSNYKSKAKIWLIGQPIFTINKNTKPNQVIINFSTTLTNKTNLKRDIYSLS